MHTWECQLAFMHESGKYTHGKMDLNNIVRVGIKYLSESQRTGKPTTTSKYMIRLTKYFNEHSLTGEIHDIHLQPKEHRHWIKYLVINRVIFGNTIHCIYDSKQGIATRHNYNICRRLLLFPPCELPSAN